MVHEYLVQHQMIFESMVEEDDIPYVVRAYLVHHMWFKRYFEVNIVLFGRRRRRRRRGEEEEEEEEYIPYVVHEYLVQHQMIFESMVEEDDILYVVRAYLVHRMWFG